MVRRDLLLSCRRLPSGIVPSMNQPTEGSVPGIRVAVSVVSLTRVSGRLSEPLEVVIPVDGSADAQRATFLMSALGDVLDRSLVFLSSGRARVLAAMTVAASR